MLDQVLVKVAPDIGLDLGTSNTRLFMWGQGVVLETPSVVAVEQDGENPRLVAVGDEAKRMLGRAPEHIIAAHPIRQGVIADYPLAEQLIQDCVRQATRSRPLVRPRALLSVPLSTTDAERQSLQESARAIGSREVMLIGKGIAAAVGAELPIHEPLGNLVVDIGGGLTEACVLSLGALVTYNTVPVAGTTLDQSITEWIRQRHNILIGTQTAEEIKLTVGAAMPFPSPRVIRVTGRDLSTGIPQELDVSTDDVVDAIRPLLSLIIDGIRNLLSHLSPELAADIADQGLVLTGGTALLAGLDQVIGNELELPVVTAEDPRRASVLGIGALLSDPEALERLLL